MKILIVKLGALGDVVRTMPLAKAMKKKFPDAKIHWVTKERCVDFLETSKYIDKIFTTTFESEEEYDKLYNFDFDKEATEIASRIKAKEKFGFYHEEDFPAAFNLGSEYYVNTIFDDSLKKENRKTYQEMMFEAAELDYDKEHAEIELTEEDKNYAKNFFEKNNLGDKKIIGVHMGASSRWPSKVWAEEKLKQFIEKVKERGYDLILFGGPNEVEKHDFLIKELKEKNIDVKRNDPNNTAREFAAIVEKCDVMVCSDSFSLHVSLAMKKPTIGLFFCTTPHEVEDYGLLKKIVSTKFEEFFPEKMDQYDEELINSISVEEVFDAIESIGKIKVVNAIVKNKEDKFLIIKRKSLDGIHPDKWAFPGGKVEKGESEENALEREIKEEVGLDVKKILKKISEYNYERPGGMESEGKCYLIDVENLEVVPGEDVAEWKWASVEEFEDLDHIEGLEEEAFSALLE